ncbi:hypothetical protein [Shewanella gelidii]|nr:hypothetical protein [Shewanella gelidii]MCL1098515.1 hypothetical protein [Shewanella gelidii]
MINHHFRRNLLLQRFTGIKGSLAFILGLCIIILALIALPFLLLFGAISFLILSLFGRVYLKQKMNQFHQAQETFRQSQVDDELPPTPFERDGFTPKQRQGQTFEHDPNA